MVYYIKNIRYSSKNRTFEYAVPKIQESKHLPTHKTQLDNSKFTVLLKHMGKLVSTLVTFSVFIGIILLVVTVDRTDYVCPGTGCGKGVPRPVQEKNRARIKCVLKNMSWLLRIHLAFPKFDAQKLYVGFTLKYVMCSFFTQAFSICWVQSHESIKRQRPEKEAGYEKRTRGNFDEGYLQFDANEWLFWL